MLSLQAERTVGNLTVRSLASNRDFVFAPGDSWLDSSQSYLA
jgi:hypothetical protein